MFYILNKKRKKLIKTYFLLFNLVFFAFPNFTLAKDNIGSVFYIEGAKANTVIKAYYEKPTLPEIPIRKARKIMKVTVTAYNSEEAQTDDTPFITAFGTNTREGIVATNFLPRGTLIRFPEIYGDKIFIVEDRMNKRYYYNIDIWMEKKIDAINFGAKVLTVEIL